jgi:hypothetical protein
VAKTRMSSRTQRGQEQANETQLKGSTWSRRFNTIWGPLGKMINLRY